MKKSVRLLVQSQQALNGDISTKRMAAMKPIGRASSSKIINQMILHNKLHIASTILAMLLL